MRDYIISGVPLRDPEGVIGIDYTRSKLAGESSRTLISGADFGMHGAGVDERNFYGTAKETLVLNIDASDKDEFAVLLAALDGLFGRKDFDVLTAPQRTDLISDERTGNAFAIEDDLQRTYRGRQFGTRVLERVGESAGRVTYVVENLNAFYRSVSTYQSAPLAINKLVSQWDLSGVAGDSNAPLTAGVLRVRGPISANGYVRLFDADSSRMIGVVLATALTASQRVEIDFETLSIRRFSSGADLVGTDISAQLDVGAEGSFSLEPVQDMSRWPAGSTYRGTVRANGYSGAASVDLAVRRSYLP